MSLTTAYALLYFEQNSTCTSSVLKHSILFGLMFPSVSAQMKYMYLYFYVQSNALCSSISYKWPCLWPWFKRSTFTIRDSRQWKSNSPVESVWKRKREKLYIKQNRYWQIQTNNQAVSMTKNIGCTCILNSLVLIWKYATIKHASGYVTDTNTLYATCMQHHQRQYQWPKKPGKNS